MFQRHGSVREGRQQVQDVGGEVAVPFQAAVSRHPDHRVLGVVLAQEVEHPGIPDERVQQARQLGRIGRIALQRDRRVNLPVAAQHLAQAGGVGMRAAVSLGLGQCFRQRHLVQPQLPDQRGLVLHNPLFQDAVAAYKTVGDLAALHPLSAGRSVEAVAQLVPAPGDAVRTVKAVLIVAAPDHLVAV